jgi:hypothetical protein
MNVSRPSPVAGRRCLFPLLILVEQGDRSGVPEARKRWPGLVLGFGGFRGVVRCTHWILGYVPDIACPLSRFSSPGLLYAILFGHDLYACTSQVMNKESATMPTPESTCCCVVWQIKIVSNEVPPSILDLSVWLGLSSHSQVVEGEPKAK